MEFKSGIEPTEKYCSMETMNGALKLVRDVMLAKEGETVVVTCDSSGDRRVAEAIGDAAYAIGAKPIVLYYLPLLRHLQAKCQLIWQPRRQMQMFG